jgi:hypothetical protein
MYKKTMQCMDWVANRSGGYTAEKWSTKKAKIENPINDVIMLVTIMCFISLETQNVHYSYNFGK